MRLTQRQGDEESELDQPDQSSAPSGLLECWDSPWHSELPQQAREGFSQDG